MNKVKHVAQQNQLMHYSDALRKFKNIAEMIFSGSSMPEKKVGSFVKAALAITRRYATANKEVYTAAGVQSGSNQLA